MGPVGQFVSVDKSETTSSASTIIARFSFKQCEIKQHTFFSGNTATIDLQTNMGIILLGKDRRKKRKKEKPDAFQILAPEKEN